MLTHVSNPSMIILDAHDQNHPPGWVGLHFKYEAERIVETHRTLDGTNFGPAHWNDGGIVTQRLNRCGPRVTIRIKIGPPVGARGSMTKLLLFSKPYVP